MNNTPLEYDEQCTLVEWMEYKEIIFTAIPNSTFTKSWSQKTKNKKSGLRAGLPDLLIIIPDNISRSGKSELLWIEMKRQKGGVLSETQKQWIDNLKKAKQKVFVCKGCDEAIEVISNFLK